MLLYPGCNLPFAPHVNSDRLQPAPPPMTLNWTSGRGWMDGQRIYMLQKTAIRIID